MHSKVPKNIIKEFQATAIFRLSTSLARDQATEYVNGESKIFLGKKLSTPRIFQFLFTNFALQSAPKAQIFVVLNMYFITFALWLTYESHLVTVLCTSTYDVLLFRTRD